MEMVLLLLGVSGLAALLGVFDDSDDDGAAPDIELDGLEPTGQHFAVVNDTLVKPADRTAEDITLDVTGVEDGQDRIALGFSSLHFSDPQDTLPLRLDLSLTEDGSLLMSEAPLGSEQPEIYEHFVLSGLPAESQSLLEIHQVQAGGGTADVDYVDLSLENVLLDIGDDSAERIVVDDPSLDLALILGEGGNDTLEQVGDVMLAASLGEGDDSVDLSGGTGPEGAEVSMHFDDDMEVTEWWFQELRDGVRSPYLEVDAIDTEAGNDSILLGERAVQIDAAAGNDTLTASTDATGYLLGGAGDDLIDMRNAGEDSRIAVVGGDGTDTFYGSAGADYFIDDGDAAEGVELFDSGAGDDVINGNRGSASVIGGEGNDVISGYDVSYLDNGRGFTYISRYLDDAVDTLEGGAGNDTLIGSTGDILTGGTGADEMRVIWSDSDTLVETATVITDFDPSEDTLRISVDQAVFSGDVTPVLNEVGGNTEVIVQGERVAVLQGTTGLTQGDLRVDYY